MIDITGKRFGRLVVIKKVKALDTSSSFWECACDCGKTTIASSLHLRESHTKSCGCLKEERNKNGINKKHGMSKNNRTYKTWKLMRARCNCKTDYHYKWYGARGIKVCERWNNYELFLEDMGERPDGQTLDRINGDGMYCKKNCRWATPKEQAVNNRGCFKKGHNGPRAYRT